MAKVERDDDLYINAADIASANVGFALAQVMLQALVARGILSTDDVHALLDDMEFMWSHEQDDKREPVAASALHAIRAIRSLFDTASGN